MPVLAALLLALAAAQDKNAGTPFSSEEGNYKVVYPKGWVPTKNPADFYQISLLKGGNFLAVSGSETETTLEALVGSIEEGQKQQSDNYKSLGRATLKIAGERAFQLRALVKREGISMTLIATVFTHQGCAYRLIGVHALGTLGAFETDYQSVLASFAFLGERKEWLDRYEGKPSRTAFIGGLASLELNRPRWTESTFRAERDYRALELVHFDFMGQGAWITVRARLSNDTLGAGLERLQEDLAGRLKKSKIQLEAWKGRAGNIPGMEISGEYNGEPYFFDAAVVVMEGIVVDLYIEGYERQKDTVRRDWNQLLAGFVLQPRSKPERPLAYPLRTWEESRTPDPAIAAILARAKRVSASIDEVAAVSPDGSRILLFERNAGNYFIDAATGKRQKAAFEPAVPSGARWSRDGKRLVWAGEEGLALATVDPPNVRTLGIHAADAAFGAADGELLACTSEAEHLEFTVSRLEWVGPKEERKMLVDFPLSRVTLPELSPDGRRLALVSNRDYPRSASIGGHVYAGAADGSGLRQLTKGPEHVTHLFWSTDGRNLFAVRRMSQGKDGAVGFGGPSDLWRIPADGGEPKNLTRSDHISGAWAVEGDLLIRVQQYGLPESQQGLFRISPQDLEKASAALPERPLQDSRAQGAAVAARVREALGGGPLRDVVPTPERMAAAAKVFAAAIQEASGVKLDFTGKSLDLLPELIRSLDLRHGDPALLFGFGAYYGEALRTSAGAEWMLQPVPFGDGAPGLAGEGTPLADPVFPFSDVLGQMLGSEDEQLRGSYFLGRQDHGRKIILVHPPAHRDAAVRAATGPEYYEARKKLDAGEVRPALDLLVKELERRPRNRALALEVIGLCEAARMPDVAKTLTAKAVEAGNEVPELLLRYAEELSPRDPAKALEALRKAAHGDYPQGTVFLRLGKAYATEGDRPMAEACWRRAHANATPVEKGELHSLLGMPKAAPADE